ncbi:serine hydrolase domain-containing protein [Flindersiella endophytica]
MHDLSGLLTAFVDGKLMPGAVGLVSHGDRLEVAAVGSMDVEGTAPMRRDSIFRIASITKPIVAAAVMLLVEEGSIALADPVDRWLPELAAPKVVRTPDAALDDVVPAVRPITVLDVLTSRTGWGFPSDFSHPQAQALFDVQKDGRHPRTFPPADEWLAALARIPLLYQPGEAWLYDTSSTIQGILISRVSGQELPEFLAERLFEPLGMVDTAFEVPEAKRDRFTSYYEPNDAGDLVLVDGPDGQWSSRPPLALGNGGLAGTVDDWFTFARMLLGEGTVDGRRVLSPDSVRLMTTNHLTPAQRASGELFLEGQGWGFGGSVDLTTANPWNVPGRYGWDGGTGTSAHLTPATGSIAILFTQRGATSPIPATWRHDFWRYAASTTNL